MRKKCSLLVKVFLLALFLHGCSETQSIVNNVDEREANEIVVFLASKKIAAQKMKAPVGNAATGSADILWNIAVPPDKSVAAMSYLNQAGLPRRRGVSLLDLFSKGGLMTTEREETIRYHAGLEAQLKSTIRKIDGVLDVDVQISFPPPQEIGETGPKPKPKASIYVKHQGVLDDPNNHLDTKIKRLVAGSIDGLTFENVTVVSDRARYFDLSAGMGTKSLDKSDDYVSIWSVVMTRETSNKFRSIFFIMIFVILLFAGAIGYFIYRFYPQLQKILKEKKSGKEPTSEKSSEDESNV